ncbi:MAG: hypothetical protein RL323_1911, partial [Pseudomonadota bacterium]
MPRAATWGCASTWATSSMGEQGTPTRSSRWTQVAVSCVIVQRVI